MTIDLNTFDSLVSKFRDAVKTDEQSNADLNAATAALASAQTVLYGAQTAQSSSATAVLAAKGALTDFLSSLTA